MSVGIEKWQVLRILEKYVYVVTFSVVDLQHHGRAATQ